MPIKMSELVKRSGVPKSTILYYVKEGLLSQPQKPKPNLHLYDENMVDKIHLVSYLQKQFDASIAEIKSILASKAFNWDEGFAGIWETLNILMGATVVDSYSHKDVCRKLDISSEKLNSYLERGLLFLRDGRFTNKELEIVEILLALEEIGAEDITESYIAMAKEIALKEVEMTEILLEKTPKEQRNETTKTLFDTTLILKPYLLNMQTLQAYQNKDTQKSKKDER